MSGTGSTKRSGRCWRSSIPSATRQSESPTPCARMGSRPDQKTSGSICGPGRTEQAHGRARVPGQSPRSQSKEPRRRGELRRRHREAEATVEKGKAGVIIHPAPPREVERLMTCSHGVATDATIGGIGKASIAADAEAGRGQSPCRGRRQQSWWCSCRNETTLGQAPAKLVVLPLQRSEDDRRCRRAHTLPEFFPKAKLCSPSVEFFLFTSTCSVVM